MLLVMPFAIVQGVIDRKEMVKITPLLFVGAFVGWFGVGTIVVLLAHLIGWLRALTIRSSENSN
jgi:hypothetical protein